MKHGTYALSLTVGSRPASAAVSRWESAAPVPGLGCTRLDLLLHLLRVVHTDSVEVVGRHREAVAWLHGRSV
jgi:hypothetical protein